MVAPRARRINIPLRHVALMCGGMLFVLLAQTTYLQGIDAERLNEDSRNLRTMIARFESPRGKILLHDGTVIATSRVTGDAGTDTGGSIPTAALRSGDRIRLALQLRRHRAGGGRRAVRERPPGEGTRAGGRHPGRRHAQAHHRSAGAAGRLRGTARHGAARRRRRDRPEDRRDPGHGVLPLLRPERLHDLQHRQARQGGQAIAGRPRQPAAEPDDPAELSARVHLQGRHLGGGAQLGKYDPNTPVSAPTAFRLPGTNT